MPNEIKIKPIPPTHPGLMPALALHKLPTADLATSRGHYFLAELDGQTVGFGGYESLGRAVLLRSIVVTGDKKTGLGRSIALATLENARDAGSEMAFLMTEEAAAFFDRLGFTAITRDETPAAIKAHPQFDRLCPETAVIMKKRLLDTQTL